MKTYLLSLFLLLSCTLRSQTLEKYYDYSWKPCASDSARFYSTTTKTDSGYVRSDFYIQERVLQMSGKYVDLACDTADGHFRFFYGNGSLASVGNYVHGLKNGLWLGFHYNNRLKDSTVYKMGKMQGIGLRWHSNGSLSDSISTDSLGNGKRYSWFDTGKLAAYGAVLNSKKSGKWRYYHKNGNISSVEIYKEGKLLDKTYFDEEGYVVADTSNNDKDPLFPGGDEGWLTYLSRNGYFPDDYKLVNGDKAIVEVKFLINEEGKVTEVFISNSFHPVFDRIAKNAVSSSPQWDPAIRHNHKVSYWKTQYFSFTNCQDH